MKIKLESGMILEALEVIVSPQYDSVEKTKI